MLTITITQIRQIVVTSKAGEIKWIDRRKNKIKLV